MQQKLIFNYNEIIYKQIKIKQKFKNMYRIVMTENDLISLVSNNLTFNDISFSYENLLDLTSGEIVEIDNNLIILQDIGSTRIGYVLDKYKKI